MSDFIPSFQTAEYYYENVIDDLSSVSSTISSDIDNAEQIIHDTVNNALNNVIEKFNNKFMSSEDVFNNFKNGSELLSTDDYINMAQKLNNYSYSQSFYMFFIKYKNKFIQLLNKLSIPQRLQKLFNTIKLFLVDNKFIKYISKLLFSSADFVIYVVNFIKNNWVNMVFSIDFADWILFLFTGVTFTSIISIISPSLAATYSFTMPILIYIGTIIFFISIFISVALYFKESQPGKYIIDILHNKATDVSNEFTQGIQYIYNHIKSGLSHISF
jgi:phage-related protein